MKVFKRLNLTSLRLNMVIGAFCKPLSMIISYIYVPIALDYLGVEKYGVWSTILSIVSWIGFFDIGIGNGLRNKLTESLNGKDGKEKTLVSSAYAFAAFLMISLTILFTFIFSYLDWNKLLGIENINESLYEVIVICICFVAVNFVLSLCKNILFALQKAAVNSIMELFVQIINLGGVIIAIQYTSGSLFVMALIYGTAMVFVSIFSNIILYAKHKNLCPSIKEIQIKTGMQITNVGLKFFVIQICALVLFSTDSLFISYLYNASEVTPYNMVNKLFSIVIGLYTAMIAPIWSNVTKQKANKNYEGIKVLLHRLHLIMLPFFIGTVAFSIVLEPISRLWLRKELSYSLELIAFGCLYCILSIWCNTYAAIANGMEVLKASMILACVQAIVNIPISFVLAEPFQMKAGGILGGTVISMSISAIILPFVIKRKLFLWMEEKKEVKSDSCL